MATKITPIKVRYGIPHAIFPGPKGEALERGFPFFISFSSRRVYCLGPATQFKETEAAEQVYLGRFPDGSRRYRTIRLPLRIPYCERHMRVNKRLNRISDWLLKLVVIPLTVLGAVLGGIVSIPIGDFFEDPWGTFLIGALLGGGVVFLVTFFSMSAIEKLLMPEEYWPHYIHLGHLGFDARVSDRGTTVEFEFTNASYAELFIKLNPGGKVVES
jgi:hypothetical protein